MDVFESPLFQGRRRRLFGPAQFVAIRSSSTQWGISIQSAIVGPAAHLRLYRSSEPRATALWIHADHSFKDLAARGIGDDVDSIAILERPPQPGEIGFETLIGAPAQQKTHG